MDAFEIRMALVGHLRKLNATLSSVNRVVDHLNVHAECAGDLWKCILQECKKGSLNHKLNILYMLDELITTPSSSPSPSSSSSSTSTSSPYRRFVAEQLPEIVNLVVPEERNGIINWQSTLQILESWKIKHLLDTAMIDEIQRDLEQRRLALQAHQDVSDDTPRMSDKDILRRFEEDRERHKRLREEIWVLPISSMSKEGGMNFVAPSPGQSGRQDYRSNLLTLSSDNDKALDVEFDNVWESTSDYNEDDVEEMLDDLNNLHRAQEE